MYLPLRATNTGTPRGAHDSTYAGGKFASDHSHGLCRYVGKKSFLILGRGGDMCLTNKGCKRKQEEVDCDKYTNLESCEFLGIKDKVRIGGYPWCAWTSPSEDKANNGIGDVKHPSGRCFRAAKTPCHLGRCLSERDSHSSYVILKKSTVNFESPDRLQTRRLRSIQQESSGNVLTPPTA